MRSTSTGNRLDMKMNRNFALVMIVLLVVVCLTLPYDHRKPAEHPWPKTLDAAVADILDGLSEADKEVVRQTKYEDLIQYHHGWGTGIRNEFGLWRGNDELMLSVCGKPCLPDTASMLIIRAVWRALKN